MKQIFKVTGMSCAACQRRVEKACLSVKGVKKAKVELLKNTLEADFANADQKAINDLIDAVITSVKESGYGCSILKENENSYIVDAQKTHQDLVNLITSIVLTLIIMIFSMGPMIGVTLTTNAFASALIQGVLTFAVMAVQKKYFISALKSIKTLSFNMDVLVALGAFISFAYSLYIFLTIGTYEHIEVLSSTKAIFFEGAAGILTFVSIGKYIEAKCKVKTTNAISALYDLAPKNVTLKVDGQEVETTLDNVKVGDTLILKQGQRLGIDGTVVSGTGFIDESSLTGESLLVSKKEGDKALSSTILKDGYLEIKVEKTGSETTLGKIISLVEKASATKVPLARIADTVASYFVPAVIVLSVMTFAIWYFIAGVEFNLALKFGICVLVISCPCALGLATPVAVVAGTGKAASLGIIFKNPESIEALNRVDTICFDKTGTLTKGQMQVSDFVMLNTSFHDNYVQGVIKALEQKSSHPIAKAIFEKFKNAFDFAVENYEYVPLIGVEGSIEGERYTLGNAYFADLIYSDVFAKEEVKALTDAGKLVLVLFKEKEPLAVVALTDTLKTDAKKTVSLLQKANKTVYMLTGDSDVIANNLGRKLNLDVKNEHVRAQLKPEHKALVISDLQKEQHKVAMVGDGINDAISLTKADVGISLKGSTDIAISSADIVLIKDSLVDIVNAFTISKMTIKVIKQNLFWALIYNVLMIPLAAGLFYVPFGLMLNPMICSCLMGISSVIVVLNAIRLSTLKLQSDAVYADSSLRSLEKNQGLSYNSKSQSESKIHNPNSLTDSVKTTIVLPQDNLEIVENKEIVKDAKMAQKTVKIEGMMCQHCVKSVTKALEKLDLQNVQVSLDQKQATFDVNAKVSDETVTKAIEDIDFKVVEIK